MGRCAFAPAFRPRRARSFSRRFTTRVRICSETVTDRRTAPRGRPRSMAPRGRRIPIASASTPTRRTRTPSVRWPRRRSLAARPLCADPSATSSRSTSTSTVSPTTVTEPFTCATGRRSRRTRHDAWAATHPWSRSWNPAARCSRWAEGRGRSRPISGARYTRATRAAASRGVRAGGGWTPITSSIGRMAAQPASTTWWCSVGTIIGWSTRVATPFTVPRPASWNSGARTGARSLLRLLCRSLASLPARFTRDRC